MRVFDLDIALLSMIGVLAFWFRRTRLKRPAISERALLLQGLILGILIGILTAFLGTGNIWTSVRFK